MEHIAERIEAADRPFQRFGSLTQVAGLAGGLGPTHEDDPKAGIVLGGERLRPVEQAQRLGRIEAECAFPGEERVVG